MVIILTMTDPLPCISSGKHPFPWPSCLPAKLAVGKAGKKSHNCERSPLFLCDQPNSCCSCVVVTQGAGAATASWLPGNVPVGRAVQANLKPQLNSLLLPQPSEWGELFWRNRIPGTAKGCECDHKSPKHPGMTHSCRDVKMPPVHPAVQRSGPSRDQEFPVKLLCSLQKSTERQGGYAGAGRAVFKLPVANMDRLFHGERMSLFRVPFHDCTFSEDCSRYCKCSSASETLAQTLHIIP